MGFEEGIEIGNQLSFALQNLNRNVILTCFDFSDIQIENELLPDVYDCFQICRSFQIFEVCIYYQKCLYRANRVLKNSTVKTEILQSPNFPPLGYFTQQFNLDFTKLLRHKKSKKVIILKKYDLNILKIYLTPF